MSSNTFRRLVENRNHFEKIEVVRTHPDAIIPSFQTAGAAGADLHAVLDEGVDCQQLMPGHRALIQTGLRMAIPDGFEAQIRPRSGLALKHGVTVLNAPGTIDSDYRGPIGVILCNLGAEPFDIRPGDRIAQIVFAKVIRQDFIEVDAEDLDDTERGAGGFGSTGVRS